jgi:predicted metal-binding protein
MILPMENDSGAGKPVLKDLVRLALDSGASDAAVISPKDIVVRDELAALCRETGCAQYGVSASCPPHVSGPSGFRALQQDMAYAVAFRMEVPSEILLSSDRRDVFRLLHEIAAGVERAAKEAGYSRSAAFAGGSCKPLFCPDHATCRVVDEGGPCRNPDLARPSMSGFGVDVSLLMQQAGWTLNVPGSDEKTPSMSTVAGLVLVG